MIKEFTARTKIGPTKLYITFNDEMELCKSPGNFSTVENGRVLVAGRAKSVIKEFRGLELIFDSKTTYVE
jgi:hypothetical protein